jgi:hypothetical protein
MILNNNLYRLAVSFQLRIHLTMEHPNSSDMNTAINQEILLVPASSFFKKDWLEKNNNGQTKHLSQKEQLIQLCWNGVLPCLLPEICEMAQNRKPLTLWEINETGNMLDLRMGETNQPANDEWSINPYVYLELAELN